jgi:hypothetical protein
MSFCSSYLIAQEMSIIRVAEKRIAGDKGRNDGVKLNQKYTIYRKTSSGSKSIGSAQVFVVKSSICALNLLYNDPNYPVETGDLLKVMDEPPNAPGVTLTKPAQNKKQSTSLGGIGIRGGIGTDISGGLVFGGSLNYLMPIQSNPFEIGLVVFTGRFTETTEDIHIYEEQTDILVFGLIGNYLINYDQRSNGLFFLIGTGVGYIDVGWEERSDTDESLGTTLPGGGSKQIEEASVLGFILDFGLGIKFSRSVDVRFEVPVFVISSAPESASSILPTFVLTLGVRFN